MYDCYIDGFGKIEPRFFRHLDRYGIAPNLWPLIKSTREETGDLIAYVRDNRKNVDKINLFFSDLELREQLRGILKQDPAVCVSSAVYNNLEINDAQATKGCGLSALAAHLGIDVSQIMAFGDGEMCIRDSMGTASTMQIMAEALGLMLPGTALMPATAPELKEAAYAAGKQLMKLVEQGITAKDIVTMKSFENAIRVHAAISGSTNATMHIPAIAHEFGFEIDADLSLIHI